MARSKNIHMTCTRLHGLRSTNIIHIFHGYFIGTGTTIHLTLHKKYEGKVIHSVPWRVWDKPCWRHDMEISTLLPNYNDVIMSAMASQITSLTFAYSTVYSGADQTKHQSSASPASGNSPVTGEFPAQRVSNAENVSTWWRHHGMLKTVQISYGWQSIMYGETMKLQSYK